MSALGQGNRLKKDLKVTKQRFYEVHLFVEMYFIGYSVAMNPMMPASIFSQIPIAGGWGGGVCVFCNNT